jgi:hypothetical protein
VVHSILVQASRVAAALLLAALATPACGITWQGRVTDADTGSAIEGATVSLWGRGSIAPDLIASEVTDAAGAFVLTAEVELDDYHHFTVGRTGYVRLLNQRAFDVDPTAANFELRRLARLEVITTADESGQPLAGVTVRADAASGFSDAGGRTVLELPPGEYAVCADKANAGRLKTCLYGHEPGWTDDNGPKVMLPPGELTSVEIASRLGGTITGTISIAPSGRPASVLSLQFFDVDGNLLGARGAVADPLGVYAIHGLPEGAYRLRWPPSSGFYGFHDGQLYAGLDCLDDCEISRGTIVTVAAGETTPGIDFEIRSKASISGRLTSADTGVPIPGARVSLWRHVGWIVDWSELASRRSDADGMYHFDLMQPELGVRIGADDAPGHRGMSWPMGDCCFSGDTVTPGVDVYLTGYDFAMQAGPSISGRVVSRGSGRPLPAEIVVRHANGNAAWRGRAGPDGRYLTPALQAADYRVSSNYWSMGSGGCVAFPSMPCYPSSLGDIVSVSESQGATGVDMALPSHDVFADGFEPGLGDTAGRAVKASF